MCYYGTGDSNGKCFQFMRTSLNFTNALRYCRVNGHATLARSLDPTKNQILQDAAQKLGIEEFWIGASKVDNDWKWLNGQSMASPFSNFDIRAGYPMKTKSQVGAVSIQSMTGLWYTKIDTMQLPFVCERPETDEYDQGIMYRVPKTTFLLFPSGGSKPPQIPVESADQSVLYTQIGPNQLNPATGERIYLKTLPPPPPGVTENDMASAQIFIVRRRERKKLEAVIISEKDTVVEKTRRNRSEMERNESVKNFSAGYDELREDVRNVNDLEEFEKIHQHEMVIKRG